MICVYNYIANSVQFKVRNTKYILKVVQMLGKNEPLTLEASGDFSSLSRERLPEFYNWHQTCQPI